MRCCHVSDFFLFPIYFLYDDLWKKSNIVILTLKCPIDVGTTFKRRYMCTYLVVLVRCDSNELCLFEHERLLDTQP